MNLFSGVSYIHYAHIHAHTHEASPVYILDVLHVLLKDQIVIQHDHSVNRRSFSW